MRHSLFATCGLVLASALLLTGCDVSTPSRVETGQMRLLDRMKTVNIDPQRLDEDQMDAIGDDFRRNGKGEATLVMSFMQGIDNEVAAKAHGNRIKKALAAEGIKNVKIDYVPVDNEDFAGKAILSYDSTVAAAPEGCGRLTGYQGAETMESMRDYQFGCENMSIISQMVSRPEDLMGTSGAPDGDSRRHGILVERYKSGTPNPRLEGMNASEVGR